MLFPRSSWVFVAGGVRGVGPLREAEVRKDSRAAQSFADTSPVCVTRCSRATMRTWLGEGESICPQTSQPSLCSLEHKCVFAHQLGSDLMLLAGYL